MACARGPHHQEKLDRRTHLRPLQCLLWSSEMFLLVLTAFASLLASSADTARKFLRAPTARVLSWLWLQVGASRPRFAPILPPRAICLHLAFF